MMMASFGGPDTLISHNIFQYIEQIKDYALGLQTLVTLTLLFKIPEL